MSSRRRVVITGMGLVSPLGNSKESLWESLAGGQSGVRAFQSVPPQNLPTNIAAEAWEFTGEIDQFGPMEKEQKKTIRKALKVMCRESLMGVAAAQAALADAGLAPSERDPERTGVVFGSDYMLSLPQEFSDGIRKCGGDSGRFEYPRWGTDGLANMNPLWLLKYLPNMPASHIAIFNDLRGPNNSLTQREASSNLAVGEAFHTIVRGSADRMVAGATGTRVHVMKAMHAAQTEQLAAGNGDPTKASRPFDAGRTGMVLGEGAGVIVLEELEAARARGAAIYGEVLAAASGSATDRNCVARGDQALAAAIRKVLAQAGMTPDQVGHVNAHGLSTLKSDADEARAIAALFGESQTPVVAPKSYFGNLGAGSGAVELIASLMALRHGRLFPVLNYERPDPECPVAAVTAGETAPGGSLLNLNVTPQGQAAVVLVGAWGEAASN